MDPSMRRREGLFALLLVAFGVVVVFAEAFAGRAPVMRDFIGFTYPSRAAFRSALASGEMAWNPLAELGLSRLAAPVHGALYPGHLLLAIGDLETGVVVTWIAHTGWAAWGGYLLARAFGTRPVAATIGAAVWSLGGYAVSMWWNGEKVLTSAWIPWFAFAIERACRERAQISRFGVLAAVSVAMIVGAGDPFLLIHAAALALAVLLARSPSPAVIGRRGEASRAVLAGLLGLGLSAPVLFAALAGVGDTVRAALLPKEVAEAWSLSPVRVIELALPGWFGNPFDVAHYPGAALADDPTRQALPWAVSIYTGAAALVFVPCVRDRRAAASLGGGALFFLFLAFGRHTPINAAFCQIVPGFSVFRYPEKHLVVVVGLLALLASLGAEEALSRAISPARLFAPPLALVALLASLGAVVAPPALRATLGGSVLHVAMAAAILAVSAYAAQAYRAFTYVIPFVAVLDLALAARPFLQWAPRPVFTSPFASALRSRFDGWPPRVHRPRSPDFEDAATLPGSAAQVFGIAAFPGHDPASSVRLATVLSQLAGHPARLAQLLALDALVLTRDAAVDLPPAATYGDSAMYLLPRAPRAWLVGAIREEGTARTLSLLASDAFDPYAEGLVPPGSAAERDGASEIDPAVVALEKSAPGHAGACTMSSYRREYIELACEASRPALVVVSELYADGWRATLDDAPARMLAVDILLRGVAMQAGKHRIAMRYEAPGLDEGFVVAGASCSLVLLGWGLARVRARRFGRER
jgi:hypothetical protein